MYPTPTPDLFRSRRDAMLARMPDRSAALFVSLPPAGRNGDVRYPYRPDSDLWYLTGFAEPDCALLLTRGCSAPASVLFLRDRDRASEIWTGERVGVEEAPARLGVDEARSIDALEGDLPGLIRRAEVLIHRSAHDDRRAAAIRRALVAARGGPRGPHKGPTAIVDPTLTLHELRMHKRPEEIDRIRAAVDITDAALQEVIATTRAGTGEWTIQASLERTFRGRGGWGWSYPTIVAAGANACVLHYDRNECPCAPGDLVLIDAGAEIDGYGADVSRTFPVDARFTAAQRDVYEVVLDAQRAAIDAVAPGATLDAIHGLTVRRLCRGMLDLGLLQGTLDEALESESFKRYYPHQTSHWLGLDVHDVGRYYLDGEPRRVAPGTVFTVEPGIYVPAGDERAPEALRGIGVRIEDDLLVTDDGAENLTAAIPKQVADIEELKRGN